MYPRLWNRSTCEGAKLAPKNRRVKSNPFALAGFKLSSKALLQVSLNRSPERQSQVRIPNEAAGGR